MSPRRAFSPSREIVVRTHVWTKGNNAIGSGFDLTWEPDQSRPRWGRRIRGRRIMSYTRAHTSARMPTCTFLYTDIYRRICTYIFLYRYICIYIYIYIYISICVYTYTHREALHLAGAHIIAGIHNADVFMALTRLFLVRCRPRPTPPRPCPYPSCNHK